MSAFLLVVAMQAVPIVNPLVGPPKVQWLVQPRGDLPGPSPDAATEALRLGLFGDAPPTGDPSCSPVGAATAATPGFAPTITTSIRLVPRLTLVGFGRGGCVLDGASAGGLVYMMPIKRNIDLALSAGMVYAPHAGPNGTAIRRKQLRADFVFKRKDGGAFTLGIGTRGITVGGLL